MRTRRLALIASTMVALGGSLTGAATAASAQSTVPVRVFTASDSGRTITMIIGTTFKVRLANCADCGDEWSFSQRPVSRVVKVEHRAEVSTATPPAVGGEAHTIWTFQTERAGKTTMRIAEHSAEQGGKVIKRFTLTIKVLPIAS
jgi:hypothetical protein